MSVPLELQPVAISRLWERFTNVAAPGARFFPMVANPNPGTHVRYEVLSYSRVRPNLNVRGGPPIYTTPPVEAVVDFEAFTWSEGIAIPPQVLKDLREPGTETKKRGAAEVARSMRQLRLRYERMLEWLRWQALQGVITYRPLGSNTDFTVQIVTNGDGLIAANAFDWSTAAADEQTARENLDGIRADFEKARAWAAGGGCQIDRVIMNTTTCGYLNAQCILAGVRTLEDTIIVNGRLTRLFGTEIEINDETYEDPISGATTNHVPDDVAIFLDSDNTRTGRTMYECEPAHVEAPSGSSGIYWSTFVDREAPGSIKIAGEWNGGPAVPVAQGQYVLQDVTAGP
jgi:hypothetical protein